MSEPTGYSIVPKPTDEEPSTREIPPCEGTMTLNYYLTALTHMLAGEECTLATDIVLSSSDGVRFGAHTRNLEIYSDGFPSVDAVRNSGEDVMLSEESDVLMLLLKFLHKQPQPDLSLLASKLLIKLANAAEKYGVYCATGVCKVMVGLVMFTVMLLGSQMFSRLSVEDQPFDAFLYAQKHGYSSILDKAGKCVTTFTLYRSTI